MQIPPQGQQRTAAEPRRDLCAFWLARMPWVAEGHSGAPRAGGRDCTETKTKVVAPVQLLEESQM